MASTSNNYNRPLRHPSNPVVFFDVDVGGHPIGRIKMELFKDVAPQIAETFRQYCTGEKKKDGVPIGYKKTIFHRVIRDFMVQGGDFNGVDIEKLPSTTGTKIEVEELQHDRAGLLSMASSGFSANNCQFFITCGECDWLNKKHIVFGQVLDNDSMLVVRKIENGSVDGASSRPRIPVTIYECGEF
ncbi:peptidyl-prolyl cis-trans isomerase H-like [Hylaeus volcanicus]|uniref:peptidyl-prolyl cis-trans isomerase H-like n=1 Tax=Hylaeus volcanicus TaxID=313075 RepID=UPI0023B77810|nr:peptidyl-prolyl cis-trans isomerase H-like [Hylaeus volcanicus]